MRSNTFIAGETTGKTTPTSSSSSWSTSTNSNASSLKSFGSGSRGSSKASSNSSSTIQSRGNNDGNQSSRSNERHRKEETSRQRRKRIETIGGNMKHSLRFKPSSDHLHELDNDEGSAALLAAEIVEPKTTPAIQNQQQEQPRVKSRKKRGGVPPQPTSEGTTPSPLEENGHVLNNSNVFDLRERSAFANLLGRSPSSSSLCTMALDGEDGSRGSQNSRGSSHRSAHSTHSGRFMHSIKNLRSSLGTTTDLSAVESVSTVDLNVRSNRNSNPKHMQMPEHWVKSPTELCIHLKNSVCCSKGKERNDGDKDGDDGGEATSKKDGNQWGWGRRLSVLLLSILLLFVIVVLVCATTDEGTVEELFPGDSKAKLALFRFRRYIMVHSGGDAPTPGAIVVVGPGRQGEEEPSFVIDEGNADVLGRPQGPDVETMQNAMMLVEERQRKRQELLRVQRQSLRQELHRTTRKMKDAHP